MNGRLALLILATLTAFVGFAECRAADGDARDVADEAVNVAPFARVLSWEPKATEGTKALRSDEFPAEDVAPYKEIVPSADGTHAVPVADGTGCIGLMWDEDRLLRQAAIEFADAAAVPKVESVGLQVWTGESAWQGKWQPAAGKPTREGNRLVRQFADQELPKGTQKVRWVFSDATSPIHVKGFSAYTRSKWQTVEVRIEAARPGEAKRAEIEIYNGVFLDSKQSSSTRCTWDGTKPLVVRVRASAARPFKADRTVLRFRTSGAAFGVAVEDLLARDCVYVPLANLFVTREPSPVAPAEYLKRIADRKSTLEDVRSRADQDFRHAREVIHNPVQDRHNWAPMLISLACDNRKFLVYRQGAIVFNEYNAADDYPGESDGVHTIAADINQWHFVPTFGSGQELPLTRHLLGDWLPMPVTTTRDKNVTYQQTSAVIPVGEAPPGRPAWFRDRALAYVEYRAKNEGAEPADVRIALRFTPESDPKKPGEPPAKKPAQLREVNGGFIATSGDRLLAYIDVRKALPLSCKIEPEGIVLSGKLPGGGRNACAVYIPGWKIAPDKYASLAMGGSVTERVESYWESLFAPAMQIEVPDRFLDNLIRASQVHCMLAARNQEQSKYIVPWISSIHFAYPESEANSILRGMDMTGHPEFARRGLAFYLKESNPAGFITIIVRNKAAGIEAGYTLVGTGEVLWTLGEHYERSRDCDWLKKVAPDVVRICHWVMRQREKTQFLDARGVKTPEYGLMPPGVSADWNRFAYRFFNEAQWYRGLELAGRALADIGDPAAPAILEDAKNYREDITRAYRAMQAKMPVVPLKNGTWAPADPSILGCYGNVEDFLPGEDENRSYVYSVELGASHLVVDEVLDPASPEADWMIDYLEDVQFLRTHWVKDKPNWDAFDWGGFAKMQPYYCRIAEIYAKRDDVKPFIQSYFNPIPALVNFEDLSFWEDMIMPYASGAFNKTHETGWFLSQTGTMLVSERNDDLWLAPFVTNQWLKDGLKIAVRNAPTRFGTVGYTITSHVGKGEIEATVELPENCTAKKVVLRLRHPEGKPIRSVSVGGKPHADFNPDKETITFEPAGGRIALQAKY